MSGGGCISMEIRVADEPAAHLGALLAGLAEFFEALGDVPKSVWTTSPGGRSGRTRAFTWKTMAALGADANTGTISSCELRSRPLEDRPGFQPSFDMSLYLRDNPGVPLEYQPPAKLWIAVQSGSVGLGALPAAGQTFVTRCAEHMPILHGGITHLDNLEQASCEATGGMRSEVNRQPPLFQQRREHDWWMNKGVLRTKCRRLYWTTMLGPTLASAAGGAEAARAAGALDVREVNGSLIFQAMAGPPRDSLDPEFLAATVRLRRWLWPHTFQNPLDAAGFEAEVGLPVPDPT